MVIVTVRGNDPFCAIRTQRALRSHMGLGGLCSGRPDNTKLHMKWQPLVRFFWGLVLFFVIV